MVPRPIPNPRSTRLALALAFLTTTAGCHQDDFRHAVFPAGGTVTRHGKPLANAMVIFYPEDSKTIDIPPGREGITIARPTTRTDDDGAFRLSTYMENDGAPAGDYRVVILDVPPKPNANANANPTPNNDESNDDSPETAAGRGGPRTSDAGRDVYAYPNQSPSAPRSGPTSRTTTSSP